MKTDKYIKIILTAIALNLTILTINQLEIIPPAFASENNIPGDGNFANYGLLPLNEDGSITVKLGNSNELDVNITGIDTYDKLNVNIDDVDSYAFDYCTLKVEVVD